MIITNSNTDLVNNATTVPTLDIDMDGDGNNDVKVTVATASMLSAQGLGAGNGMLAGAVGTGGFFYPTAFQGPSTIGSALGFGGNEFDAPNSFGTLANGVLFGNWATPGGHDAYLGVKFDIGGNSHFGWVHVIWDPNADAVTIANHAFESQPGVAAVIPEPSALSLLGLGVLGLAARRRRREDA